MHKRPIATDKRGRARLFDCIVSAWHYEHLVLFEMMYSYIVVAEMENEESSIVPNEFEKLHLGTSWRQFVELEAKGDTALPELIDQKFVFLRDIETL